MSYLISRIWVFKVSFLQESTTICLSFSILYSLVNIENTCAGWVIPLWCLGIMSSKKSSNQHRELKTTEPVLKKSRFAKYDSKRHIALKVETN